MFHSRFGLVFMNAQLGQLSSSTWPSQWFRTPLAEASLTLLPAKAFLHSRKMKLCYLHSESMSSRFPLTTCHCYVFVLSTLICSSGCLVDKGVYWGVCHYPSKVWRRTSMPGINTVKSASGFPDVLYALLSATVLTAYQPVRQVCLGVSASESATCLRQRNFHMWQYTVWLCWTDLWTTIKMFLLNCFQVFLIFSLLRGFKEVLHWLCAVHFTHLGEYHSPYEDNSIISFVIMEEAFSIKNK